MNHYENPAWTPWLQVALFGAVLVLLGIICQCVQLWVSIRDHRKNVDVTGDLWGGRTLEWAVASPPPFYNFALTPTVHDLDALWDMKERGVYGHQDPNAEYEPIHMPRNTPAGFFISIGAALMGFALIWHIWWLAAASVLWMLVCLIVRTCNDDIDYFVPVSEVERIEHEHHARVAAANVNEPRLAMAGD